MNRKGADSFKNHASCSKIKCVIINSTAVAIDTGLWIVDGRNQEVFSKGHLPYSINLMEEGSFETWLGTIIKPGEKFYLAAETKEQLERLIERTAAIGYEPQIEAGLVLHVTSMTDEILDINKFRRSPEGYTVVDVRGNLEVQQKKIFENSINIPLTELRDHVKQIPLGKPIVVHCASGYRSAAASSIVKSELNGNATVYNLGDAVKQFM
ncbi:MAG: hypothetical protein EOP48_21070 [Sphingobacteriales bacterium]|nr:MAG: hypothetical protein EOP48_21070 [Sphingobacteriales bacterium]